MRCDILLYNGQSFGKLETNSEPFDPFSSDGSAESHVVEPEEMVALTQELKRLKEALGRLKKVIRCFYSFFLTYVGIL